MASNAYRDLNSNGPSTIVKRMLSNPNLNIAHNMRRIPLIPASGMQYNNSTSMIQNSFSANMDHEMMTMMMMIITVDSVAFSLHKFPLLTSSGKLRRMAQDRQLEDRSFRTKPSPTSSFSEETCTRISNTSNNSCNNGGHTNAANAAGNKHSLPETVVPVFDLPGFPGGPDMFELTAKACCGMSITITNHNVAPLLCASKYLDFDTLFDNNSSSSNNNNNVGPTMMNHTHMHMHNMPDFLLYSGINLVNRCQTFLDEILLSCTGSLRPVGPPMNSTLSVFEQCVDVLHSCEPILHEAEELKIANRCIDSIASNVCSMKVPSNMDPPLVHYTAHNHAFNASSMSPLHASTTTNYMNGPLPYDQYYPLNLSSFGLSSASIIEHWATHTSVLRIDLFQRVMCAMRSRGLDKERLGGALILYTEENLMKPLKQKGVLHHVLVSDHVNQGRSIIITKPKVKLIVDGANNMVVANSGTKAIEHEQRILAETIVSMLPKDNGLFHTSFLFGLLKASIVLDTTVACQMDLERRVSLQLENASVNDLLVQSISHKGWDDNGNRDVTINYDVDVVQRVLAAYLREQEEMGGHGRMESSTLSGMISESDGDCGTHSLRKVVKLIDQYLAEISTDPQLTSTKFVSIAELFPDYARSLDDGLYRAIDIYLKAHPTLPDMERKRMCKLLDCQKLSQEACAHAAQNERLPVQVVVQVLYFEQLRMRNAMLAPLHESDVMQTENIKIGGSVSNRGPRARWCDRALSSSGHDIGQFPTNMLGISTVNSSPGREISVDPYSSLRRENRELKLEAAKLQLRVNELEIENGNLKQELTKGENVNPGTKSRNIRGASGGGGFLSVLSRRLGRIHIFSSSSSHSSPKAGIPTVTTKQSRNRRHSIS